MLRAIFSTILLVSSCAYAADIAGEYAGTWSSSGGPSGNLHFSVAKDADSWDCKLVYSSPEQGDVTPKPVFCAVDGNKLKAQFVGYGEAQHITIEAILTGSSLEGTYTAAGDDGQALDSGKWKASTSH